jgi:hypothetical protein
MSTANKHPELISQLTKGIAALTSSSAWERYLQVQSQFHRYSFGNCLLIATQCPEATQVAGFHAWRKMGRFVRKGEKALFILAPMVYKASDEATDNDPERVIRGFKWVGVFDVSQTDGDDLPQVCHRLTGDDPNGIYGRLVAVAQSLGFTVHDVPIPGEANGECSHQTKTIRIEVTNTAAQRAKSLAHEIAHAILHAEYSDRALAELEAESVAWVICQSLGLDTSDYSFGYVASWSGGGDAAIAGIKASCERIQKTAATVLRSFETDEQEAVA